MKFIFLFLSVIIAGCSYPNYQMQKLDELTFQDKRPGYKTIDIREFIRPEETTGALRQLETVSDILHYTQNLKQTNDKKDFWQYPKETLEGGGDCEDKTFLLLSMLIQGGVTGAQGVKGRFLGQGHMWVECNGYILDPSRRNTDLIPIQKSIGYTPYFKFDQNNIYYCSTGKEE